MTTPNEINKKRKKNTKKLNLQEFKKKKKKMSAFGRECGRCGKFQERLNYQVQP
jgi:hypothetical protein